MASDRYTDDEYDDTYEEVHGDEPARDQYAEQTDDDGFFPYAPGWGFWPAGWGFGMTGGTVDADEEPYGEYDHDEYDRDETAYAAEEDDESWWDEGLIGLLLVVGVVLFLFPEPATSALGIGLIAVGVLAWLVDWAT